MRQSKEITAIDRAKAIAAHLSTTHLWHQSAEKPTIESAETNQQVPKYSKFDYASLRPEGQEIRLVRILPGLASQGVEIRVFHARIDRTYPDYEALSYAWGTDEKNYEVVVRDPESLERGLSGAAVGGSFWHLAVSSNLANALYNLRSTTKPRTMWVDAICINQEDLEERSREVGKMGAIYSMAQRVVVWLGEASGDSHLAIGALASIAHQINFHETGGSGNVSFQAKPGSKISLIEQSSSAWRDDIFEWMAIRNLLNRAWFTRLWVFQEISHASDAVVVVGTSDLEWSVFRSAVFWIIHMSEENTSLGHVFDATYLSSIEPLLSQNLGRSLESLLDLTKMALCYDPRDRIYALLSLLRAEDPMVIVPNYQIPAEEVFRALVLRQLELGGDFRFMGICGLSNPASNLDLPSWVPDLSVPNRLGRIRHSEASGGSRQETEYDSNGNTLRIRGHIAGLITQVSTSIPLGAKLPEIQAICHAWEPKKAAAESYFAGGTVLEAFIQTLFFGTISDMRDFEAQVSHRKLLSLYNSAVIKGKATRGSGFYSTRLLQSHLPGRAQFRTREGYIGLCPASTQPGDLVVIVLGCKTPVVVRPTSESSLQYQVAGDCYVHGLMSGEGLLGQLPRGWRSLWLMVRGERRQVFESPRGLITQVDPRAGEFPSDWQVRFKDKESEAKDDSTIDWNDHEIYDDSGLREPWFENKTTGELTRFDPRLRSENLKERGVDIHDFTLI